ncbi:MAG: hypothetical protein ACYCZF_07960 [Anaerolineae bacterium]
MYNRILLLASGLACGWMIVHTWSVADHDIRGQRIRLIIGIVVGLGLVGWLSWSVFTAGLVGLVVFGATALIAYAANARQVNRLGYALPPRVPKIPEQLDTGTVILLVTSAEPTHYTGPGYWARALRQYTPAPNWFFWPRVYSRIRLAYRVMGGAHPLDVILASLSSGVGNCLSAPSAIHYAYLGEERAFLAVLVNLAEQGFNRLVLVLLEDEKEVYDRLHDLVARSGILDTPLVITYARPNNLAATDKAQREQRLACLVKGEIVTVPAVNPSEVDALCSQISPYLAAPANGLAGGLIQEQSW